MSPFAEAEQTARAQLIEALEPMGPQQRINKMVAVCLETGGTFVPQGANNWGPHFAEISVLGVYHAGNDMAEAVANWIKAAIRRNSGQYEEPK